MTTNKEMKPETFNAQGWHIYEARKRAIRMASELCRKALGGQWGSTILRDDNIIVLCGERRLSAVDRQGFTVYVTPGTNATQYTLD